MGGYSLILSCRCHVIVVNLVVRPVSAAICSIHKTSYCMDVVKKSQSKTANVCLHFESTELAGVDKFVAFNKSSAILSLKLLYTVLKKTVPTYLLLFVCQT